jgi:uncharacterized repeat protein (TIGR02543 family)
MKKNLLLSFSAVLCAVVLVLSGCEVLSNPDKGTETYTVTFNANAGADSVTSLPAALTGISSGSKITAPAGNPVRNGYYFGGWYKESSCTTKWNFDSDTVSSSVTLYASWTVEAVYTVTFDANAGTDTVTSLPAPVTGIKSGSKITAPAVSPVRSGYSFGGWYKESSCITKWDFDSDTVSSSLSLYASWTTYTVTFDANAGTDTVTSLPAPVTGIAPGAKITKPSVRPVRSGYYFGGWYTESGTVSAWDFSNDTVSSFITLYASWLSEADYYCIQFDTGASGWVCDPLIAKKDSVVNLEEYCFNQFMDYCQTENHFAADGIYKDEKYENTSNHNTSYAVTESTTLYIKMLPMYVVTIYPNGGEFSDSTTAFKTIKMTEGDFVSGIYHDIPKPTKAGYVFSRWTSDEAGTTEVPDSTTIASDLTLYAQWAKLDTSISGWWLYTNADGGKCFMNLDALSGSGVMYDVSVEHKDYPVRLTVTDTKLVVDSEHLYAYTCSDGKITFNGVTCVRPSEQKTAGGNDSGTYYVMGSLLSLKTDNTCTLTSTQDLTVSLSGKWCRDDSSLCLLDDDSNLVMALSGVKKLDYDTLGGHYYNYSGSAACSYKNAYSLYLDKDGTYHFYIFSQDIQGSWYAYAYDKSTTVYLSGGYDNNYQDSMEYDAGTSSFTSNRGNNVLTQSSSKCDVPEFAEDPDLTGTWSYSLSGATMEITFTSDGIKRMHTKGSENSSDSVVYYTADKENGVIYTQINTMPDLLGNSAEDPYTYKIHSDGTLAFYGVTFTKE